MRDENLQFNVEKEKMSLEQNVIRTKLKLQILRNPQMKISMSGSLG